MTEHEGTSTEKDKEIQQLVNGINYAKKMEFIQFLKNQKVMNYKSQEFEINFYCDYDINMGNPSLSKLDDPILTAFGSENE